MASIHEKQDAQGPNVTRGKRKYGFKLCGKEMKIFTLDTDNFNKYLSWQSLRLRFQDGKLPTAT